MEKLIKAEFSFPIDEIDSIRNKIMSTKNFNLNYFMYISDANKEYKIELVVYRENKKDANLEIIINPFNDLTKKVIGNNGLKKTYKKINKDNFIGVKSVVFKDIIKGNIEFLINVTLNKRDFRSRPSVYGETMACIYNISAGIMSTEELINELKYYDFKDDVAMMFCSCLFIKEGRTLFLNPRSKYVKLYTDKLYYAGIDIFDYVHNEEDFTEDNIKKKENREEVRDLLMGIISYLMNSKEVVSAEDFKIYRKLAYLIFCKYTGLY